MYYISRHWASGRAPASRTCTNRWANWRVCSSRALPFPISRTYTAWNRSPIHHAHSSLMVHILQYYRHLHNSLCQSKHIKTPITSWVTSRHLIPNRIMHPEALTGLTLVISRTYTRKRPEIKFNQQTDQYKPHTATWPCGQRILHIDT